MYKIIDTAVMPDGTKIQLEDWHSENSEEYPNLYGYTIAAYPVAKNSGRSGWTRLGEEFRVTICRNEHMQYSDDMVLSDYEALKNGAKTLADLKEYFQYKTKDEYYLGLNDIEPEFQHKNNGRLLIMYEKISEEEIRREKVEKVKNKILSEIDNRICSYKKLFAINEKTTEEDYNFFISENFALLELKKYLKRDNCFMSYEAKYLDKDIVVYVVSEKTLNVWMQKDYNFIYNYLDKAEENEYNVFPLLNDKFFGYEFLNSFDYILYDEREE